MKASNVIDTKKCSYRPARNSGCFWILALVSVFSYYVSADIDRCRDVLEWSRAEDFRYGSSIMEHFALERYSQSTRTNEEDASAFGLNLPDIFELKTSSDKKKEILKTIQSFKAAYDYKSFEEYLKFNYQEPEAIEAWKACIQGTNLRLYAESTGEKHSYIVTAGWGDQFSKSLKDITWYVSEIAEVHTDGYTNSKFGRDSLLGDVSIHISRGKTNLAQLY